MEESRRIMQERNLGALVRNKSFVFTNTFFPYTSGKIGPYYVQSVVIENNGEDYFRAIGDLAQIVNQEFVSNDLGVISGGESRDWDFSNPLAVSLRFPHCKIYKDGKILGADVEHKRVLHVADLNNEGSSIRDLWVPAIENAGGEVIGALFYVDRLEDGVQVMEDLGLRSHSLVPLNKNAWEYLLKRGVIDEEIYRSLRARMEDKDAWARSMLKSERGIETLAELPEETRKRIIEKGYLEIREELIDRLKSL